MSRRTNTIILWIIAIGLMVGMVIMFTPTMGLTPTGDTSQTVMTVDGERLTDLQVAQARQASPIFNMVDEGPVAEDLELLLVDGLVRQEVLRQEASRQRVTNGQVRDELEAFRERNGVEGSRNDDAYLRLIGGAGYTDQTFREYLRQQLQVAAYQEEVVGDVEVSEAEVESFYRVNQDAYRSEPRVVARQIVTDDRETAEALRERAEAGESFADLASEASVEGAEEGGALGGDEPRPVGRPAFPTAVADAVFSRTAPGLTPVVESAGRFYVVSVEELVPAEPRPLDEVREQVREDALAAKQQAELDERIDELVREAEVTVEPESGLSYENPTVARVGDAEIHAAELARATYTNPQIQQVLSPDSASLIAEFFKPSILEQLVDRELAVQGAEELDATFFGSDALLAQSALDWVSRDVEVDDEQIRSFYEANQDRYTVPASAEVRQAEFADQDAAMAYREEVLDGADPAEAADAAGASFEDRGTVREGDLEPALDTAVFATDGFDPLPDEDAEVSDVLVIDREVEAEPEEDAAEGEDGAEDEAADAEGDADAEGAETAEADEGPAATTEEVYVVLVAERTPERVRPLEEVRSDVEQVLLSQERQEAQREWLDGLREEIEVEVLLPAAAEAPTDAADALEDAADGDAELGELDLEEATDDGAEGSAAAEGDAAATEEDAGQDESAQGDAAEGDAAGDDTGEGDAQ